MDLAKIFALFGLTALAEIIACYLPYLWHKQGGSVWLLIPAVCSLGLFVWLLTLHPNAAGRIYAAYGDVYISVAIIWLWLVQSIKPSLTDWAGVIVCLIGVSIIMLGSKST
jgi:small multidrug resistance family-3 protein